MVELRNDEHYILINYATGNVQGVFTALEGSPGAIGPIFDQLVEEVGVENVALLRLVAGKFREFKFQES